MNGDIYSIAESADALKVNRRTIARAIADGRLQWHGESRRGRYARGLALSEVRQAINSGVRKEPALLRCKRNLGQDWQAVMRPVLIAALNGGDVDMLASCAGVIRDGYSNLKNFRAALAGDTHKTGFGTVLATAVLAAGKGDVSLSIAQVLNGALSNFPRAWGLFVRCMIHAPASIDATLHFRLYEKPEKRLGIEFSPAWLPGNRATWPDYAGRSVVNPLRALRAFSNDLPNVHAALTRISRAVPDVQAFVKASDLIAAATDSPRFFRCSRQTYCRTCSDIGKRCPTCESREYYRGECGALGIDPADVLLAAKALVCLAEKPEKSGRVKDYANDAPAENENMQPIYARKHRRIKTVSKLRLFACPADVARALGISRAAISRLAGRPYSRA